MRRRDSILPLLLSAVIALAMHAAVVPAVAMYAWADGVLQLLSKLDVPIEPPTPEAEPEEPDAGREDSKVSAIAWVSHDDFRELMARQAPVDQPGLQQAADPVEQAPPELDPTPPAPTAAPTPLPSALAAAQTALAEAATPLPSLRPPTPSGGPGEPQPFRLDDTGNIRVPFAPTPLVALAPRPQEAAPEAAPATPTPTQANPTSSPRSDREAAPARLEKFEWSQAGSVPVGRGIEVRTFAPRFSVVADYAAPHNPELVIHFDRTGQALRVDIVKPSGFETIDGPVLAALYKWRASGERIAALAEGETLELPVRMLLRGEKD